MKLPCLATLQLFLAFSSFIAAEIPKDSETNPGGGAPMLAPPIRGPVVVTSDQIREFAGRADEMFRVWLTQMRSKAEVLSETDKLEGIRLAQTRADKLKSLMQQDPKAFMAYVLPTAELEGLPPEVRGHLERRVDMPGFYGVICVFPVPIASAEGTKPTQSASFERTVIFKGDPQEYTAFVYGGWVDEQSRQNVQILGIVLGNQIVIGEKSPPKRK